MSTDESPAFEDARDLHDVVAIDGPSGAGKSTVARRLAARLGCLYLDTGAMYRAVTWYLLQNCPAVFNARDSITGQIGDLDLVLDRNGEVRVSGRDVSAHLRSQEVEARVSLVSSVEAVRTRMRSLQRSLARHGRLVAEGRDMGSVVFPAAKWKFFLDADPVERARRRCRDFAAQGRAVDEAAVLEEIEARDHLDGTRADAPLVRADGAIVVNTTGRTIDEIVAELAEFVEAGRATGAPK